jgi:hypothetical protein
MTKQNQKLSTKNFPFHFLIALVNTFLPFIVSLFREGPTFVNEYEKWTYFALLWTRSVMSLANYLMYNVLN